MSHVAAPSSPK